MEQNKPFPIYQLMDAFEAFSNGEADVKPQHRSLYYFLLGYARKRGNVVRYNMPYENGMHGSGIGSWATYDTALKALAGWGFIVYTPGANRFKVPVIELTFRNPTDDVLLTYWQSYCLSTCNPTDSSTGDNKRLLEEGKKRIEEVETHLLNERTKAEGVRSGLEKKIEGLESENAGLVEANAKLQNQNDQLKASVLAQRPAPHTGGARSAKDPLHFTPFGQSKFATEAAFAEVAKALGYAAAYAPYYLAQVKLKTAGLDARTQEGWQNFIDNFLHNDAKRNSLVIKDPNLADPQAHAISRSSSYGNQNSAAARLHTPAPSAEAGWGYPGG